MNKIIQLLQDILEQISTGPELSSETQLEIEKDLKNISKRITPSPQLEKTDETIFIWSDGACSGNPGPGGWGTIVQVNGKTEELSGSNRKTTNNIMEMTGALEGILITPIGSKIVVTSDSQYLVKGMNEWIKGWKKRGWKKSDGKPVLNRELWIKLDQENSKRNIQWKWIKGHAGHLENERCDELARKAI